MAASDKNNILVVVRHSPYGSSLAKAAVDTSLAAAAFEQPVQLLFLGDGVLQLLPDQDGQMIGRKTIGRQLASLPLYDIETVFVDATAAAHFCVDLAQCPLDVRALNSDEMRELMSSCDQLLGF